jgi:hypothetical protein
MPGVRLNQKGVQCLIAAFATLAAEHANPTTFVKEAQSNERNITITCVEQPQS